MVAVGALTLLAACSSSGDAEPTDTTAFIPSVASTTQPTTTTTTIAPTTTPPPPTTIDPDIALAQEVEADFLEADRLANEALQDPFDTEKAQAALDRRTGFLLEDFEATLAEYRELNHALRSNPALPASVVVEVPAEVISDVAELQICEVNSWIVVEVGAGPDGTDAIVDPSTVAFRSVVFLRNVDGVWKLEGGTQLGQWDGASECPAD